MVDFETSQFQMPIYAYKCASCGFAKDVLQKLSDPPLTVCTQCSEPQFSKQVTAAGFQLKGSGWYVTDFRGGDKPKADTVSATGESGSVKSTTSETSSTSTSGDSSATSTATKPLRTPAVRPKRVQANLAPLAPLALLPPHPASVRVLPPLLLPRVLLRPSPALDGESIECEVVFL